MPAHMPATLPRLVAIEAIHVRVPFRRPLLDATGEFTHRRSWLLRLVDDAGNEGLGEAALDPFAIDVTTGALARLIREIVPALAGSNLPLWSELAAEGEPGRAAMAAIEGAVLALMAAREAADQPAAVTGTPAGTGPAAVSSVAPVPVSATIAYAAPEAGADAAAQAIELGFGTLKLRAGFERTTDQLVDRLRAIRAAVGPEPRVRIDAGAAWDLDTATERIAALEPFRIEFVEQPLAAWDIAGHAALRERVGVPIALDESVDSEGAARAALADGAADVLVVKPVRVGGLAATMRIAESASAAGALVVLGTYFETGVGIAAALRIAAAMRDGRATGGRAVETAQGLATAGQLVHDLLAVPLSIVKGRMAVPVRVTLESAEVDRYALERFEVLT
jgi:L-Ala-D/L-Glu epimerase